jgi:dephospho-CoA kinase
MLIGLTGPYCAGKNFIASLLEKRGLPVLDVDKLGYQVLETEKEAVFARFGQDLRKIDGSLDRRLLGKRVFGEPKELSALEAIVHPPANRLTEEWIASKDGTCVINAALLHRSVVFHKLDFIILVTAPYLTRLLRARRRDRLPWLALIRRFASQKNFISQYLSVKAEIIKVENHGIGGSRCLKHKLKRRIDKILIDKILEGIR